MMSLAGDPEIPDNYCHEPDCGFNNVPWAESCTRCDGLTMRGVAVLQQEAVGEVFRRALTMHKKQQLWEAQRERPVDADESTG